MSNYWIDTVHFRVKVNKLETIKKIKIGDTVFMEYKVENDRVTIKRNVLIVGSDDRFFYVDTGYLKNTYIRKEKIMNAKILK